MSEKSNKNIFIVYEHQNDANGYDIIGKETVVYVGNISYFFIPHLAESIGLDRKRAKDKVYRFLNIAIKDNVVEISDETFNYEELFETGTRNTKKHPHFRLNEIRLTLEESVSRAISEFFIP